MNEPEGVRKLFGEAEIAQRVETLAAAIAEKVAPDCVMVGLLKGSFVFMADLIRALDRRGARPQVEFLHLSSYGHARETTGRVRLLGELPRGLEGKEVLLIDDIADTGLSIAYAKELLERAGAAKVWSCVLVDKPVRRQVAFTADFAGFTVGDVFIVGYGVDEAERYRHLPWIGAVD